MQLTKIRFSGPSIIGFGYFLISEFFQILSVKLRYIYENVFIRKCNGNGINRNTLPTYN